MYLSERLKTRLFSLPEDIAAGVNAALQSSPGVAAATGSAAVAAAASATAGSFGSPQYKTKKVNLEAGSELLEYYQNQWEELHVANVKNAKLATKCDSVISGIHRGYERQFQSVMTLQMLVGQIPAINQQIESVMNSLGDLEALFGDVELALLGLEDTIDARELQERQLDQRFQMAMYQERRNAEFEELAARLRSEYQKKKSEQDLKQQLSQRNSQASFQKQFEEDMARFTSAQSASASGALATPQGTVSADPTSSRAPGVTLTLPAGHDADASLETVDLNDDEVNLDHTPLLSQDQVQDLEAFLGHGGDDDDLLGVYGRDDQRSRASGTISDSKSIDSVDSIVVSSVPVNVASLNSSPEEEEAPTPPQEDTPPAGSLAQDLLSPGDLSRTESMYYTPDTTLEKLSDVLGDKE